LAAAPALRLAAARAAYYAALDIARPAGRRAGGQCLAREAGCALSRPKLRNMFYSALIAAAAHSASSASLENYLTLAASIAAVVAGAVALPAAFAAQRALNVARNALKEAKDARHRDLLLSEMHPERHRLELMVQLLARIEGAAKLSGPAMARRISWQTHCKILGAMRASMTHPLEQTDVVIKAERPEVALDAIDAAIREIQRRLDKLAEEIANFDVSPPATS